MIGLSTSGSISLGCALVAGRKRVPRPAAGKTALRTAFTSGIVSKDVPGRDRAFGTLLDRGRHVAHHGASRRRGVSRIATLTRGSMLDPAYVRDNIEQVRTG